MANLFDPVQLGSLVLANRVFMAPLTRTRADADGVPSKLAATYYSQRASAGLIVTEATQISPMGKGYMNTPGIHSPNRCKGGAESLNPFTRAEAESSFSCGTSAKSLIHPCCQTTRSPWLHPQSVPMPTRTLPRVRTGLGAGGFDGQRDQRDLG